MDNLDLTQFFSTPIQAGDFRTRLSVIVEKMYQTDFNFEMALLEEFGINKRDQFLIFLRNNKVDVESPTVLKAFLQKIIEKISTIQVLSLTLAFEPKEQTLLQLSTWFLNNLNRQVLFEITVNPSLLAGVAVRMNGNYLDFSLKKEYDQILKDVVKSMPAPSLHPKEFRPEPIILEKMPPMTAAAQPFQAQPSPQSTPVPSPAQTAQSPSPTAPLTPSEPPTQSTQAQQSTLASSSQPQPTQQPAPQAAPPVAPAAIPQPIPEPFPKIESATVQNQPQQTNQKPNTPPVTEVTDAQTSAPVSSAEPQGENKTASPAPSADQQQSAPKAPETPPQLPLSTQSLQPNPPHAVTTQTPPQPVTTTPNPRIQEASVATQASSEVDSSSVPTPPNPSIPPIPSNPLTQIPPSQPASPQQVPAQASQTTTQPIIAQTVPTPPPAPKEEHNGGLKWRFFTKIEHKKAHEA